MKHAISLDYIIEGISIRLKINPRSSGTVAPHIDEIHRRGHLCEQFQYDFELVPDDSSVNKDRFCLKANRYITNFAFNNATGSINTAGYCGELACTVCLNDGQLERTVIAEKTQYIEVESVKLRYTIEYRSMLKYLSNKYNQLLFDASAPVTNQFFTDFDVESFTEQQYEFLRNVVDKELRECLSIIMHNPHQILRDDEISIPVNRVARINRNVQHQLLTAPSRTLLPAQIHIGELSSVPRRVITHNRVNTINTPENRFVKKILFDFFRLISLIQEKLAKKSGAFNDNEYMLRDVERLQSELNQMLHHAFFREITDSTEILTRSTVMQRRRGYRDLLKLWVRFVNGSKFEWVLPPDESRELFRAGARDAATLYEYWLYFQLVDVFTSIFDVKDSLADQLIKIIDAAYQQVILQKGRSIHITGEHSSKTRHIKAKFWYNKAFSVEHRDNYEVQGSWTNAFTPDYTISFWPATFSEDEAEANETIVHIHFDAKYRATINSIIGDEGEVVRNHEEAKPNDIIKMHAYRDAIRRTVGAFVLYPGSIENVKDQRLTKILKRHNGEILPSVGAFAVSCDDNGNALGIEHVRQFILDVIEHLHARSSLREQLTFQMYRILKNHQTSFSRPDSNLYAEQKETHTKERMAPASQIIVLLKKAREWEITCATVEGGFVCVRLAQDNQDSQFIEENLLLVNYFVLESLDGRSMCYLARRTSQIKIIQAQKLAEQVRHLVMNQPFDDILVRPDELYAVFETRQTSEITPTFVGRGDPQDLYVQTQTWRRMYDSPNVGTYTVATLHKLITSANNK